MEAHSARVQAKKTLKASTLHSDESAWRIHVQPKWGSRQVGSILQSEVKAWVSAHSAKRSPTTVARAYGVLASILDDAVQDNRLNKNPARGDKVKLPRKSSARCAYLTHKQVKLLAAESKYPTFVEFLTYTGLRWGEATGIRIAHVDRTRRRVEIAENAVSVNGHIVVGTPKTHERRAVVYPEFLDDAVEAACKGKKRDALLGGDGIDHLRPGNAVSGWFTYAVKRAQAKDPEFPRAADLFDDEGAQMGSNPTVTANEKGPASLVNKGKRGLLLCPRRTLWQRIGKPLRALLDRRVTSGPRSEPTHNDLQASVPSLSVSLPSAFE
jgi:integrase